MPLWLIYSILTVVFWGIWGFIPRKLAAISAEQQQVLSGLGLLPILVVLACRRSRLGGVRRQRGCALACAAGLVGSVGNLLFYRLLNAGENAATVVPFTSLYPVVVVVLALLFLQEKLNGVQVAGLCLAFCSMYLFSGARPERFSMSWFGFALLPIVCWGIAGLLQKLCTNDISAELSTLCFLAALIPISFAVLLWKPMSWELAPRDWIWGAALGLFLGLGNLTCLAAFAAGGKAAVVAPLTGIYAVVTVPLAVIYLQEKVQTREWVAIALAVVAVAALAMESTPAKPGLPQPHEDGQQSSF